MRSVGAAMSGNAPPSARRASVKSRISKQQQNRRCVPSPRASRRKPPCAFRGASLWCHPRNDRSSRAMGGHEARVFRRRSRISRVLSRTPRHALAGGVSPDARPPVSCTPPRPKSDIASSNLFFPPDRPAETARQSVRLRYALFRNAGTPRAPPSAGAARPDDARAVPGVRRPGGRRRRRLGRRGGRAGG